MKLKKILLLAFILLLPAFFTGCWNYRGLNEMTIVAGIALDRDASSGDYLTTFEILDLSSSVKEKGISGAYIESRGKTVFEAIRNAKKKLLNKLFFGNIEVLILSRQVAEEGISSVIDVFLRDGEPRETLKIAISEENTAKEILESDPTDTKIISFLLSNVIEEDNTVTASTRSLQLYEAYTIINSEGICLTAPAFSKETQNGKKVATATGIALFDKDCLKGFLPADDTKYYLMALGKMKGGAVPISSTGFGKDDVTLEVDECRTKKSYTFQNNKIKVSIQTELDAYAGEIEMKMDIMEDSVIADLEEKAGEELGKRMKDVVEKAQTQYGCDIFGFGNMIYDKNPELWASLKDQWKELFPKIEVETTCKVKILNSALIKEGK